MYNADIAQCFWCSCEFSLKPAPPASTFHILIWDLFWEGRDQMYKVTAGIRHLPCLILKKMEESTEKNSCTGRKPSRHACLSSRTLLCYTPDCLGNWRHCWSVFTRITSQRQQNYCPFSQQGLLCFLIVISLNWLSKANSCIVWKLEAEKRLAFFFCMWRPGCIVYAGSERSQPGLVSVNKLYTDCPACLLWVALSEREGKLPLLSDWSWLRLKQVD